MRSNEVKYHVVGTIHSPFKITHGIPIQSSAAQDVEGAIELVPQYSEGLEDL